MSRSIGCSFGAILIFNFVHVDLGVIYRKTLIFTQNCIRLLRMHFFNLRVQKLLTFNHSIRYYSYFKLCGDVKQRTPESMFISAWCPRTSTFFVLSSPSLLHPLKEEMTYDILHRGEGIIWRHLLMLPVQLATLLAHYFSSSFSQNLC